MISQGLFGRNGRRNRGFGWLGKTPVVTCSLRKLWCSEVVGIVGRNESFWLHPEWSLINAARCYIPLYPSPSMYFTSNRRNPPSQLQYGAAYKNSDIYSDSTKRSRTRERDSLLWCRGCGVGGASSRSTVQSEPRIRACSVAVQEPPPPRYLARIF